MSALTACSPRPHEQCATLSPYRIALLNPNTNTAATETMLVSARRAMPPGVQIEGRTVRKGEPFITDAPALARAARAVQEAAADLVAEGFDAIIVAGFGDPGVAELRESLSIPVTGLGEAGIAEAARGGQRFVIVTVTPSLDASLVASAHAAAPASQFAGVRYTRGALDKVMDTPESVQKALLEACRESLAIDGAQAIVIGGGPLAFAAHQIAEHLQIPVIDPVGAAVRLALQRSGLPGARDENARSFDPVSAPS